MAGENATYETPVRFGSGANYTKTAADGEITQHGTARTRKQIWIQAEAIQAPGVNPATFQDLGISGVWQFADNLTKVVVCKLPLITDFDPSADAEVNLGWSSPSTTGTCRWQVGYLIRTTNEDMSAAAENTLTSDESPSGTANGLVLTTFTIPNASFSSTDHCLLLRITRLGAADTLGDVANLSGICLNYVSNKLGEAL